MDAQLAQIYADLQASILYVAGPALLDIAAVTVAASIFGALSELIYDASAEVVNYFVD